MNASRATLIVSALVVALLGARVARADEPPYELLPTRLGYVVAPGLRKCPSEDLFRALVAVHLYKRDPFTATAGQRVVVELSRIGGQVQALLVLYDAADKWLGQLDPIRAETCSDAVEDASGMVVPWLLVIGVPSAKPAAVRVAASPAPPPPPQPDCPKPPPPIVAREEATPARYPDPEPPPSMRGPPDPLPGLQLRFGADIWAEQVATEQGSIGASISAGVRWRFFSAAIELKADPPFGSTVVMGGRQSFFPVTSAALACLHFEWLVGCGLGEVGEILFPVAPQPIHPQGYAAVGLRLGLEFPVVLSRVFIPVALQMLEPIHPNSVMRYGQTVYQTAGTGWGLGLGLLFVMDKP